MTWLLAPSTDRLLARRFVARLDQILGYPRTLAESEITRHGPASQSVAAPRCETEMAVYVHSTTAGVTALRGVVDVDADRPAQRARRCVSVSSSTRASASACVSGSLTRAGRCSLTGPASTPTGRT